MNIQLNGEPREVAARMVAEILKEIAAPTQGVAVAVNGRVVRRAELATTSVQEGDEVEIIRAVQGG